MPAKKTSQAERRNSKKQSDEPAAPSEGAQNKGDVVGAVKDAVLTSVLGTMAPKLPDLVKESVEEAKATIKEGKTPKAAVATEAAPPPAASDDTEDKSEETTNESNKENSDGNADAKELTKEEQGMETWKDTKERLGDPKNLLGLGGTAPKTKAGAAAAWKEFGGSFKDIETNKRKKSSQASQRMKANASYYMPQYLHILLAFMALRAFLVRSWFACLPWLMFYQVASTMIPLNQADLPESMSSFREKVPLDKVTVGQRTTLTLLLHALMILFFAFESVYYTYWFEKIPLVAVFALHAYQVRHDTR